MKCKCGHADLAHTSGGRCVLCTCEHYTDPAAASTTQPIAAGRAWMIRADLEIRPYVWQKGMIGVSWGVRVPVPPVVDREEMLEFFRQQPNLAHESEERQRVTSRELFTFVTDVNTGDLVLTPMDSKIYVGRINGPYEFKPNALPSRSNPVGHAHTSASSGFVRFLVTNSAHQPGKLWHSRRLFKRHQST
jgi:hypothetical protein